MTFRVRMNKYSKNSTMNSILCCRLLVDIWNTIPRKQISDLLDIFIYFKEHFHLFIFSVLYTKYCNSSNNAIHFQLLKLTGIHKLALSISGHNKTRKKSIKLNLKPKFLSCGWQGTISLRSISAPLAISPLIYWASKSANHCWWCFFSTSTMQTKMVLDLEITKQIASVPLFYQFFSK